MNIKRSQLVTKGYLPKVYLGDSVYAQWDGFHIILTTENGFGPSNTILLGDSVMMNLENYYKRMTEAPAPEIKESEDSNG